MSGDPRDLPRQLRRLVGQVVGGRYVVDDFVGMGGMAVVFKGRHATLDRSVAIKVLRPQYAQSSEIAARFDREARAASNFDHPNCVQVFDCAQTSSGLKFMVMPLLEGTELARVLGEPLPQSQCIACGLQILRGLHHAHEHGVVHRDLKPDNIFVTSDHNGREILKIVDFGIAKILDDAHADGVLTKVGAVVGTPAYMSPEQAMGGDIDPRTDLYSLGVMLYHMLTGAPPFVASDPRGLLFQHVSMPPPPLPESVHSAVGVAIATLMAKQPGDRYASATAAIIDLERIASQLRTDATPWVSLLDPARRRPARRPAAANDSGRVRTDHYGDQARVHAGEDERELELDRMDDALKRLLDGNTATAEDNLRSGIYHPPAGGWEFDTLDEEPKED